MSLTQSFTKSPMIFKTLFMGLNLLFHTSYKREGVKLHRYVCVDYMWMKGVSSRHAIILQFLLISSLWNCGIYTDFMNNISNENYEVKNSIAICLISIFYFILQEFPGYKTRTRTWTWSRAWWKWETSRGPGCHRGGWNHWCKYLAFSFFFNLHSFYF